MIQVSLPENLREFVEAEVVRSGCRSSNDYLSELVREARRRQVRSQMEALLDAGLESGPPTEMTASDWEEIRRSIPKGSGSGKK